MKAIECHNIIEKQFDYICKRAMKDEQTDYLRLLSRISKIETSFSQIEKNTVDNFSVTDQYSIYLKKFRVNNLLFFIENEILALALESLSERKQEIILLYYFYSMNDVEISYYLKLSRSTINEHRNSGLQLMKKFIKEKIK